MDPYLAIASKRDERAYADTPVPDEVRQRILDAGRLSGSSKNRQRWEFVVASGQAQGKLADAVYAPENVRTAALVVAMGVVLVRHRCVHSSIPGCPRKFSSPAHLDSSEASWPVVTGPPGRR